MRVFLLDVNVLLALAWSNHEQHEVAHAWCAEQRRFRWASCPTTQSASSASPCSRQSSNGTFPVLMRWSFYRKILNARDTSFGLKIERSMRCWMHSVRRLVGHQQVTDACLLSLAIRHKGNLATFDHGVLALLASNSPAIEHITAISTSPKRIRK